MAQHTTHDATPLLQLSTPALLIEPDMPITQALALFRRGRKELFIRERGIKILLPRFLLRSRIPPNTKISTFAQPLPLLQADTTLQEATHLFHAVNTTALPVLYKEQIYTLHLFDLLRELLKQGYFSNMLAKDTRMPLAISVSPETPLGAVLNLMHQAGIDRLPVLDTTVGFVSAVDIVLKLHSYPFSKPRGAKPRTDIYPGNQKSLLNLPIKNFMTLGIIEIIEDTPLETAVQMMIENRVQSLVVRAEPVRILTKQDILELV